MNAQARPPERRDAGFTLVEVLVAALILVSAVLGSLTLIDAANGTTVTTRTRQVATNLTRELVEQARQVPYAEISAAGLAPQLATLPGLASTAALPAYRISRGGTSFTVDLSACVMDDPIDGGGAQSGGGFCAGGAAPAAADADPEDYKVVSATVAWTAEGVTRRVRQVTIVNDPGDASAPAVTSLGLRGYATPPPQLTAANTPSGQVTVDFATSAAATPVLRIDGTPVSPAPTGDGTAFSAVWSVAGREDGAYSLSAEGRDADGRVGAGRSLTVVVNRSAPRAPAGLTALRDGTGVALSWQPNTERDVIGYAVLRRPASGADVLVCPRSAETACADPSPPASGARYVVVAYDLDPAGAVRSGAVSAPQDAA